MQMRGVQQGRLMISFLLVAFLACVGGGIFCPMAAEAASPYSQEHSHSAPVTPSHSSGDCQDQISPSSEEPTRDLTFSVLPYAELAEFADIVKSTFSEYFFASAVPSASAYPLLFLLFSVFLN